MTTKESEAISPIFKGALFGALGGIALGALSMFMRTEKVHMTQKLAGYLNNKPEHFGNDVELYKAFIQLQIYAEEFGTGPFERAKALIDSICYMAEEVQQRRIKESYKDASTNYFVECSSQLDIIVTNAIEAETDKIKENKVRKDELKQRHRAHTKQMRKLVEEENEAVLDNSHESAARLESIKKKIAELQNKQSDFPQQHDLKSDHIHAAVTTIEERAITYVQYITESVEELLKSEQAASDAAYTGTNTNSHISAEDEVLYHSSSAAYKHRADNQHSSDDNQSCDDEDEEKDEDENDDDNEEGDSDDCSSSSSSSNDDSDSDNE